MQLAHQRQHHAGQPAHFGHCVFQSFFASQVALDYFVVQPPLDVAEATDAPIAAAAAAAEAPHAPPLSDWQQQLADNDQAQHSGAYTRIAPAVHASELDPGLRITGFPQHLVGVNARLAKELYMPPALVQLEPAAVAVLTALDEQRLQALALTITDLMRRLDRWATTDHKQQCTP
jgi:hypothetical protein